MKVGISRNTYLAIDGHKFTKIHGEEVISPQHFSIKHKKSKLHQAISIFL